MSSETEAIQEVSRPVVLEHQGVRVAVVLPYDEYERLQRLEAAVLARQDLACRDLAALMEERRAAPSDLTTVELEQLVTEEVSEVREQRRARQGRG